MRAFLCFLTAFVSCACVMAAPAPATWRELTPHQRDLYGTVVAPLRAQGFSPEEDYSIFRELALEPESTALPTTFTLVQKRAMGLDLAAMLWQTRALAAADRPTSAAVAAFVASRPDSFDAIERLQLGSIYIRKNGPGGADAARALADEARRAIDDGMTFEEAALRFSDARSRSTGGEAGLIRRGQVAPETERIVFALAPGQVGGPFEREHGFYLFRVRERHSGFDLAQPADYRRAETMYRRHEAATRTGRLVEQWKETHRPRIAPKPDRPEAWFDSSWITADGVAPVPFGVAFLNSARRDLDLLDPGPWNESWFDEAAFARDAVLLGLAAEGEIPPDDPDLRAAAEMYRLVLRGENRLRAWYADVQPSETEIERTFAERRDALFPPRPLYTFLLWKAPLVSAGDAPTTDTRALMALTDRMLSEVSTAVGAATPASESEARTLLDGLVVRFPGSSVARYAALDSLSPFADPILLRTRPGTLSRPFDQPSGIGLVYMIEEGQDVATLDRVRDQVVTHLRRAALHDRVEGLRQRLQAKNPR